MPERIFNFAAGPCTLPLDVLKKQQEQWVNFDNTGMSLIEMSHRGAIYDAIHQEAERLVHDVYDVPDTHVIMLLGGGATLQFAMIPMNFLPQGGFAEYVTTGTWSTKALNDAKLIGDAREIATGKDNNFTAIPKDFKVSADATFFHLTTNNTIRGTEWHTMPETGTVPIFADMSSDFMSRKVDWSKIGIAYGGVQKNLGPAGLSLVIMRKDILEKANQNLPAYLRYDLHASKDSMYNTPPMFQIYTVKLVLEWVRDNGGLAQMDKWADERSGLIYNVMDKYPEYYRCPAVKEDRSRMNVCFRLPTEELEAQFVKEALAKGMNGLKGHRSVGGCRASLYNAMPIAGAQALADFMVEFMNANAK